MTRRSLFIAAAVLTAVPPIAGFLVEAGNRADIVGELSEMLAITIALSAAILQGLERPRRAALSTLTSAACGALVILPAIVVAPPTPLAVWAVRLPRFVLITAAVTLVVYLITHAVITSKLAKRSHS